MSEWMYLRRALIDIRDNFILRVPNHSVTKPTSAQENRGGLVRSEGGAGVADALYFSRKDASDVYAWKDISGGITQAEGDARYVNVTGDTMTGNLELRHPTSSTRVTIDPATAAQVAEVLFQDANTSKFGLFKNVDNTFYLWNYATGTGVFRVSADGSIAFNQSSIDADFTVNSDTLTAIFVNGATGTTTFGADVSVPDEAYGAGWNGSLEVPTKNAVYDKVQTIAFTPASSTGPASLQLAEDTDNGSNKITVTAPTTLASDFTQTLPAATGTVALVPTITQRTNATTILNASILSISVSCSAGEIVLGGGCNIDSGTANNWMMRNTPSGSTGWMCTYENRSGANRTITAYAICMTDFPT